MAVKSITTRDDLDLASLRTVERWSRLVRTTTFGELAPPRTNIGEVKPADRIGIGEFSMKGREVRDVTITLSLDDLDIDVEGVTFVGTNDKE